MHRNNRPRDRTNASVPPYTDADSTEPANNPANSGTVDTDANRQVAGNGNRQPTYCGGFTMIPPNDSRRSKITSMAQKEEEELERYRESQRVTSVQLPAVQLGGHATQAEARQRQQEDAKLSKLQKRLKKEEMDRQRRREEEQQYEKMKAEQRQKAERLNKRREAEEQRRKEELGQDHVSKNENFLQQLQSSSAQVSSGATNTAPKIVSVTKGLKDVQLDHKRVNAAFLDRLEGQVEVQEPQRGDIWGSVAASQWNDPTGTSWLMSDAEDSTWGGTGGPGGGPQCEQALERLMRCFPDCSRDFLEDILDQCAGDYERACQLLYGTS